MLVKSAGEMSAEMCWHSKRCLTLLTKANHVSNNMSQ